MVRRLIQQQDIAVCTQRRRQGCHLLLTAGEMIQHLMLIHKPHPVQDRPAVACQTPLIILRPACREHIIIDRHALWKFRILRQIPNTDLTAFYNLSRIRLLRTCQNPQQCGFPGPIDSDDPDFVTFFDAKIDSCKQFPLSIVFADALCCQ